MLTTLELCRNARKNVCRDAHKKLCRDTKHILRSLLNLSDAGWSCEGRSVVNGLSDAVAPPEGGGEMEPPSALTLRVMRRFSGGGGRGRPAEKADDSRMSWRRCRRMVRSPAGGDDAMTAEAGSAGRRERAEGA